MTGLGEDSKSLYRSNAFPDTVPTARPATREAIEAMQEAADVSRADLDALDDSCPVCLGDFADPETSAVRWLGCAHVMHRDCLTAAAEAAHMCPVCRTPVQAEPARVGAVVHRIPRPTVQPTTWPPMAPGDLDDAVSRRMPLVVQWLSDPLTNISSEAGQGGASPFLVPVLHHALRRSGYPLPSAVSLSVSEGGMIIEEVFRRISASSGPRGIDRSDEWTRVCDLAFAAVQQYRIAHGRRAIDQRLRGREDWPPVYGSEANGASQPTREAIRADDGYIGRRAQESLLGCPMGTAWQTACMLITQLLADHRPVLRREPPPERPRDAAGQIIDANNAEYAAAEAADLAAQAEAADPGAHEAAEVFDEPSAADMRAARLRRFARLVEHERSGESGSDSSGEESDVPSPAQDSDAVTPQPLTRAAARRRRRQRQGVDLADALAHARWVAAGSRDYRSMTLRQLRTHARARFGPQFWQELETRGNRRTALVNLLYSTDGGGH